ncbi:MAG: PepSY-associated TM helix domain-containing protein [Deinococcales bacterium]
MALSTAAAAQQRSKSQASAKKRPFQAQFYIWARWLHVYISMATLLLVLFFSLTGITLNHPDWVFGSEGVRDFKTGALPEGWQTNGQVDWLKISEYMRNVEGVHGRVSDYRNDDVEGQLSFSAPGYSADVFINMQTGSYDLSTDAQGWVAVLNDLHRGRDGGKVWSWVVDLSALFLVLVAVTGLALLLLLKKIRLKGLLTILAGTAVSVALMMLAM